MISFTQTHVILTFPSISVFCRTKVFWRALKYKWNVLQNIFFCSTEERKSVFGLTWGWMNDDRSFIFGWNIPLNYSLFLLFIDICPSCLWHVRGRNSNVMFLKKIVFIFSVLSLSIPCLSSTKTKNSPDDSFKNLNQNWFGARVTVSDKNRIS